MEGEECASRILEMSPPGVKFLGPVIIEVPHFASLRNQEREILILRSDNGETWKEHTYLATPESVQEILQECFAGEAGKCRWISQAGTGLIIEQNPSVRQSFELTNRLSTRRHDRAEQRIHSVQSDAHTDH